MTCEYCNLDQGKALLLYQDADLAVIIKDTVFIPGQITVIPKQHYPIVELVPEHLLAKALILANKVGIAIFDSLGCQGTNVLVQNGIPAGQKVAHVAIEVLPRREGDGLPLPWEAKPAPEDELESVALQLKQELEKPSPSLVPEKKEGGEEKESVLQEEPTTENYLLKALRRRP